MHYVIGLAILIGLASAAYDWLTEKLNAAGIGWTGAMWIVGSFVAILVLGRILMRPSARQESSEPAAPPPPPGWPGRAASLQAPQSGPARRTPPPIAGDEVLLRQRMSVQLFLRYRDSKNVMTDRIVQVSRVTGDRPDGAITRLYAHCFTAEAKRTFLRDGIMAAGDAATGEVIEDLDVFLLGRPATPPYACPPHPPVRREEPKPLPGAEPPVKRKRGRPPKVKLEGDGGGSM